MSEQGGLREALAEALRGHQAVATGLGEWCCKCSPMEWRPTALRSRHQADALLPVVEEHVRRALEEAERDRDLAEQQATNNAEDAIVLQRERDALRERLARVEAVLREREALAEEYAADYGIDVAHVVRIYDVRAALGDEGREGGADGALAGSEGGGKVTGAGQDERPSDRRTANEGDA